MAASHQSLACVAAASRTPCRGLHQSPARCEDKPWTPKGPDDHPYITKNARYLPGFSFPAPRKLTDIVKIQLLERESPHHIRDIWTDHHDERDDTIATTMPVTEYRELRERGRKWPRLVYIVRRDKGQFYTLVGEWQDNVLLLTALDDYRRDPNTAEPYMSLSLYDDLAQRKQIVLVRGDFSYHLHKRDAERILRQVRHWYLHEPQTVEQFNERPGEFDFQRYVDRSP